MIGRMPWTRWCAALLLAAAVGLPIPRSAHAIIKEQTFYCWDEKSLSYENNMVDITFDGTWEECFGGFDFDNTTSCDRSKTAPDPCACGVGSTIYAGEADFGLYHKDTPADHYAQGFFDTQNWMLIYCDRNGDGKYDAKDTAGPSNAVTQYTGTGATIRLILKDEVLPCGTGNCSEYIVSHFYINMDPDCDGVPGLGGAGLPAGGLCFYAEARKPGTATYMWQGNLQAYLSGATGGEKTVNFRAWGDTPVIPSSFSASFVGGAVVVGWETSSEIRTVGFNLYRQNAAGLWEKVNGQMLLAVPPAPGGGIYQLVDPGALPGETYTWAIGEMTVKGAEEYSGPYTATVNGADQSVDVTKPHGDSSRTLHALTSARGRSGGTGRGVSAAMTGMRTGDAVRIGVVEDGLYLVDAAQIASLLNLQPALAKRMIAAGRLSLENRGQPVAYSAASLNSGLLFYGQKADSPYTDENVYWLTRGGEGLVMGGADAHSPSASYGGTFTSSVHAEVDNWALTGIFDDPAGDFWLWDFLFAGYDPYQVKTFTVPSIGAAGVGTATLTVNLKGEFDDPAADPDHHVVIQVNGTGVGEGRFNGIDAASFSFPVDQGLLVDGDNAVTVSAVLDPGVANSLFWVDSFDLTYRRRFEAAGDSLVFTPGGNAVVTVGGFTRKGIGVFDITTPLTPTRLRGLTEEASGDGTTRVSFQPASGATYLATTVTKTPASVAPFVAAKIAEPANAAEYLVIAPSALVETAGLLVQYRRTQGLSGRVIDLQSIYDEFNHGLAEPAAIKAFLADVYANWPKPPRFVVLAGKGTFDYKDVKRAGDNLIPVTLVSTPAGLFAADNRFADVVGDDGVPEMAIGRLPVVTAAELETLLAKMQAYEIAQGPWRQQVLMAADLFDPNAGNFPDDSDDVALEIPSDYAVTKIHLTPGSIAVDRPRLLDGINAGAYLLNYIGHGAMHFLAKDRLLQISDMPLLANGAKLPLTAAMTCLAGRYEMYGTSSLAEELLLDADGGSAAVWTATGYSRNAEAVVLDKGFVRALFSGGSSTLGEAVRQSLAGYRANGGSLAYMLDIYNLLGDPALRIR